MSASGASNGRALRVAIQPTPISNRLTLGSTEVVQTESTLGRAKRPRIPRAAVLPDGSVGRIRRLVGPVGAGLLCARVLVAGGAVCVALPLGLCRRGLLQAKVPRLAGLTRHAVGPVFLV